MAAKIRRVAVIGAGPSGAIATDALIKEQAFDTVRVFDRRAEPGGTCCEPTSLTPRWTHTYFYPSLLNIHDNTL
ncbi:uncharacterized protein LY79DRAFT_571926, partial [Colletotrichum navitas]